jgi:hypothetical protein
MFEKKLHLTVSLAYEQFIVMDALLAGHCYQQTTFSSC